MFFKKKNAKTCYSKPFCVKIVLTIKYNEHNQLYSFDRTFTIKEDVKEKFEELKNKAIADVSNEIKSINEKIKSENEHILLLDNHLLIRKADFVSACISIKYPIAESYIDLDKDSYHKQNDI